MKFPGITKRAVRAIQRLMATLPEEMKKEEYLPTIGWIIDSNEPGFVPHPNLGGMEKGRVPDEYILHAHGLKFAYTLSDALLEKYKDSVLDYVGGNFIFVDKTVAHFMGSDLDDPSG